MPVQKKLGSLYCMLVCWCFCFLTGCTVTHTVSHSDGQPLPVKIPDLAFRDFSVRNKMTYDQINNIIGPDSEGKGLVIDLQDSSLMGKVYTGPYPFEAGQADIDYFRFRKGSIITNGMGTLEISDFFRDRYNANNWPEGQGWEMTPTIGYRLDLYRIEGGNVDHLGFYDSVVSFEPTDTGYRPVVTIKEGPSVSMVNSNDPSHILLTFRTSEPCVCTAVVQGGDGSMIRQKDSEGVRHAIGVDSLKPDTAYSYHITCVSDSGDQTVSSRYRFRTAPEPGQGSVRIAYAGDSREGVGGGERNYMGVNFKALNWIAENAYRDNADILLFGGDLVNGYTSDPEDFELQLGAWKQAVAGFSRSHPVYPCMGNHEAVLNTFDDGSKRGLCMDKWPYSTSSAEAIFANIFYNPQNGPLPSDPRRPPYLENVYSFQYGPVFFIAFNNNYWWTTNDQVSVYGGSPEGYIMPDQMTWIEQQLNKAESDPTVKYIILYAQEPVWPCGGHIKDAMWWNGNNNIRAYTLGADGQVEPAGPGIIEVRNRLWKAISSNPKVAAVLSSDEHEYYRVLISDQTPVGVPSDDLDGDGILDRYSPDHDFAYPTYFITAGTAGAPFYSRQQTPWSPDVLTSQQGYVLIDANQRRISLKFITVTGQVFDEVPDLMAVKKRRTPKHRSSRYRD